MNSARELLVKSDRFTSMWSKLPTNRAFSVADVCKSAPPRNFCWLVPVNRGTYGLINENQACAPQFEKANWRNVDTLSTETQLAIS